MPRRNLLWVILVVLVSFVCLQGAPGAGRDDENYEFYRLLVDALDHIEKSYVEKVDRKQLLEGALEGMTNKLDPYSSYITPDNYRKFERTTTGHFGGIGIQLGEERGGGLTVISPLAGTPAYRAGVLAGDRIIEINGEPTEKYTLDQAVSRLTGPAGTEVTITVLHRGDPAPLKITLMREEIKVESVLGDTRKPDDSWDWIIDKENKIAYIRLNAFINTSADDLDKAIKQAKADGMRGLVLDLRFNPGGLLQSAIDVTDMLIKSGTIVSTEGRNHRPRKWPASGDAQHTDFPMAVLVNHFSASASEILAAALQDNGRAKIVGERTWGKGSVQNVIELDGGKSALKLTTAEYHRPNGHNIHKRENAKESDEWGVMPDDDFVVEFTIDDLRGYDAYRRDRDILKSNGKNGAKAASDDKSKTFDDKQLQKAVEVVVARVKEVAKAGSEKQ